MSSFFKRLRYYGLGFGIGLVFVFLFFQNRGCSWLPANRVKNAVLDRVIVLSPENEKLFSAKGAKTEDIINLLNTGEVIFDKSRTKGRLKVYRIENDKLKVYFTLPDECFIAEVIPGNKPVKKIKASTKGIAKPIHFPKDNDLVYVDDGEVLSCQLDQMGYIDQKGILKSFRKQGNVDFERSKMNVYPKPEVYLQFFDKEGKPVGATAIWYKNKINIQHFDYTGKTPCK